MSEVADEEKNILKIEAVRLSEESELSVREVARKLGIHPNTLYKWRYEYL